MRRIGVLTAMGPLTMRKGKHRLAAFTQAVKQLGWSDGAIADRHGWSTRPNEAGFEDTRRNWSVRWAAGRPRGWWRHRSVAPSLQATRTVPIVLCACHRPGAAPISSRAWPAEAATRLGPTCLRIQHERTVGWSCSKTSRRPGGHVTGGHVHGRPAVAKRVEQFGARSRSPAPSLDGGVVNPDDPCRDAGEHRAVAAAAFSKSGRDGRYQSRERKRDRNRDRGRR